MIEATPRELNIPAHKIGVNFRLGYRNNSGIGYRYDIVNKGVVTKQGMAELANLDYTVRVIDEAMPGYGTVSDEHKIREFVGAQTNNLLSGEGFTIDSIGKQVIYPSGEMANITKFVDSNTVYVDLDRDMLFTTMHILKVTDHLTYEGVSGSNMDELGRWGVSNYTEFDDDTGILRVHDFRAVQMGAPVNHGTSITEIGCRPMSEDHGSLFCKAEVYPPVYIPAGLQPVCLMELVREFDCNEYHIDNCNIAGITSGISHRFNIDKLDENLFLSRVSSDGTIESPLNGGSILERGGSPESLLLMLNQNEETPSTYGMVGPNNDAPDVTLSRSSSALCTDGSYLFVAGVGGIDVFDTTSQPPRLVTTTTFQVLTGECGVLTKDGIVWVLVGSILMSYAWDVDTETLSYVDKHYLSTSPLKDSNSFVLIERNDTHMLYNTIGGDIQHIIATSATDITLQEYAKYPKGEVLRANKYSLVLIADAFGVVTLFHDLTNQKWSLDIGYFGKPINAILLDNFDIIIQTNENKMLLLSFAVHSGILTLVDTIDNITSNIGYAGGEYIFVEESDGSATTYIVDGTSLVPLGYTERISTTTSIKLNNIYSILGEFKNTLATNLAYFYAYSVAELQRTTVDDEMDVIYGNIDPPPLDVTMRELHITDNTEENSLMRIVFDTPQETIMRSLTGFNLYSKWNRIF